MNLNRMSLNQASIQRWSMSEAIEGCARHGVGHIGLWRDKLATQPIATTRAQLHNASIRVSSLCRGGFFSAPTPQERAAQIADNRRAIEDCSAIGCPLLVLVCGPARGQSLADARTTVRDAIAELAPFAAQHGVQLGIEPLHPMYAAERSVIVTLEQARTLAREFPREQVGVVADVFHIWWDPFVERELALTGDRIVGFHVSDWLVPLPDMLLGRGLMGQGVINLPHLAQTVAQAGYNGPVEVEIFNQALWDTDPESAMHAICEAFQTAV